MIDTLREIALPIGVGLLWGGSVAAFFWLCYSAIKAWDRR